jgi:hypothetical protein
MSSHHFVKEGQEPALLILDAGSFEKAAPLLEWAPLVLVSADVLDEVLAWGIKIDVVFVQGNDGNVLAEKLLYQQPVAVITVALSDDLLHAGIDFLRSTNQNAVNVMADIPITAFAGKHRELNFQCTLLNDTARWSLIQKRHFEKWVDAGTILMIFTQHPHDVTLVGCELNLERGRLMCPTSGVIQVKSKSDFWIGEPF